MPLTKADVVMYSKSEGVCSWRNQHNSSIDTGKLCLTQKRFGQTLDEEQANQIATLPQERFDEIFDALEDGVLGSAEILAMVLPQA